MMHVLTDYFVRCIPSNPNSKCVILGDFNLPLLTKVMCNSNTSMHVDNTTQSFVDYCAHAGLMQHVNAPTRGNNTLDLIFTHINLPVNFLYNIAVKMPIAQSDHSSIFFELACSSKTDKLWTVRMVFVLLNVIYLTLQKCFRLL